VAALAEHVSECKEVEDKYEADEQLFRVRRACQGDERSQNQRGGRVWD